MANVAMTGAIAGMTGIQLTGWVKICQFTSGR